MSQQEVVPPHNLEAEKAVLGCVLVNDALVNKVLSIIQPDHFYRDGHSCIWNAMVDMVARNESIDALTLRDELIRRNELDRSGGVAYISSLTDGIPKAANIVSYASIVRDCYQMRQVLQVSEWMKQECKTESVPSRLVSEASSRLSRIVQSISSGAVQFGDAVMDYVSSLISGDAPKPTATGYTDLDRLISGLRPKTLSIVAARPSVGKTAFSLGMADSLASRGNATVFFSLEVSIEQLSAQVLGWRSGVPTADMESGQVSEESYRRVAQASDTFSDYPLFLVESATTMTDVWAWCRRLKSERDLRFVFIDYLQLLTLGRRAENRQLEVSAISRSLKLMAKELDISVVALSQLGRSPEARKDKRPHVSDLRESGALEQDADLAILLFRQDMYSKGETTGTAEAIVAKNRSGPVGVVELAFVSRLAKFGDLERRHQDAGAGDQVSWEA